MFLDPTGLSVNQQLLRDGWVYPTFYSKLYVDLREALAKEADSARRVHKGIWEKDVTHHGFDVTSRDQLETELVILPKLFRRLAEFLSLDETGSASMILPPDQSSPQAQCHITSPLSGTSVSGWSRISIRCSVTTGECP